MAGKRRKKKVVRIKRRPNLFAGLLLIIFAVYLSVIFLQSYTKEHVSIYEVTEKKMADDASVRGIILRKEKLVKAKKDGHINYYVGEGARVGKVTTVYTLDTTGEFSGNVSSIDTGEFTLSAENTDTIRSAISNYRSSFSLSDYHGITNFKYNMENTLLQMTTQNLVEQLDAVSKKESGLNMVKAAETGIISFCSDGLEDLTLDSLTAKHFENMADDWVQLRQATEVNKKSAVYRLVTSEDWSLVIPLTESQKKKLSDTSGLTVTVKKDNLTLSPQVTIFTIGSGYYANLKFSKYMLRYLDNRYLDVSLQFNDADGLKLPTDSILEEKFYVVPKDFILKGGQSGNNGVLVKEYSADGNMTPVFHEVTIYYEDENGNYYVGRSGFRAGTNIVMPDNQTSMQLSVTAKLNGVYNCNRGYCEFRRIEKLYENEEYTIVKKDTTYGLSAYDHIILNPDMIAENEIIY